MPKSIAVLGSTGSIGCQALDVAREQGFRVAALAAGGNLPLLAQQAAKFHPAYVGIRDESRRAEIEGLLAGLPKVPRVLAGKDAAATIARECGADTVLNAIVGIAGLPATLAAAEAGRDIALANKESLVAGGRLVLDAVEKGGGKLLPVDSEHSAIFQCLQDPFSQKGLAKILLTASGGPFYGKTATDLAQVGPKQALNHPNWAMGAKITIDSATLMNKGLEFIEAMWLFGIKPGDIEIVVQRESIIHSMVELTDGSVLAQLGVPDMRIPIQYALTWPQRLPGGAARLDFMALKQLHFGVADEDTFRCLHACKRAADMGGLAMCAANGANEEAVALFLAEKISFLDIGRLVEACVEAGIGAGSGSYTAADVYSCDEAARRFVQGHV